MSGNLMSNIIDVFNKLSYEPVLDSDSSLKTWIASHANGTLGSFINGQFYQNVETQSLFQVKNPFNNNHLANFVSCDKTTLNKAIESGLDSLENWRNMSYLERGRILYNIARNVQKHLQVLVSCESITSARTSREVKDLDLAQIIKTLYYYSGSLGLFKDFQNNYESIGLVAICGYYDNSLLSLVNKLAPALITGNVCLLIPHKLTPLSALMFMEICVQSGLPSGVLNLVASDNDEIYKWISADSRIGSICFDGRENIGKELIIQHSSVDPNKQIVLSFEGKSSMVVYDSADLDSAVECVIDGLLYSNGQHRYSLNKLFIQENIYEQFLKRLETRMSKLRLGNHMDKCNDSSILINKNDVESYEQNLSNQLNEFGAKITKFESTIQQQNSQLIAPSILKNVPLNSQFNLNELNGAYLITTAFRTVKESVDLINNSRFGSGVCLYSQNISLVMEVAYLLNVGTVWINSFPIERGVQVRKQSGNYQISGFKSLRNFLRTKSWSFIQLDNLELNSFDQVLKNIKSFGSLNPSVTLPVANNLLNEKTYKLYIGGKQQRPDTQSSRVIKSNNDDYCLVPDASRKDVRNAVEAANSAFNSWWKRSNFNKAQILYYFGENFNSRSNELVDKLVLLTQKSKAQCELEIKMCSDVIFYFASLCDKQIGRLNDTTEYGYLMEVNEPLGCIAILCGHNSNKQDNYPLFTFVQHLIGAISFGNTVVIVPDEQMPIPALDLYEIFDTSDMPAGVVNILTGNKHHLTKYLTEHQQVHAVWYLYDLNENLSIQQQQELTSLQFIKYTSSFSSKTNWFIPNKLDCLNNNVHLNEIEFNSTQSKYINIPMGTIFAN